MIFHPVHVTMTSIDKAPYSDTIKVFFRMYYDDFLRDYQLFDTLIDINKYSPDKILPSDLVNKYFNHKVCISVNNKLLDGKLLTMDLAGNEISLNLLYMSVRKPKKIRVKNTILTGLYNDQANMLIIRINNFEEGIKLTPQNDEEFCRLR